MKQTKAAFRNKPFISLKGSILFLILIPMSGLIHAQYSMGTTGQLMICLLYTSPSPRDRG